MEINPNIKHIATTRWGVIELRRGSDGFWRSPDDTIYAFADNADSVDNVTRCGVGWFSLSADDAATAACQPHDYAYSSPVYQAFHTREEADEMLQSLMSQVPDRELLATPFEELAEMFGGKYWENDKTR